MDLAALLFDVNDVLRRFSAGRGSEVEAQKLVVAFRALEQGVEALHQPDLAHRKGEVAKAQSGQQSSEWLRGGQCQEAAEPEDRTTK